LLKAGYRENDGTSEGQILAMTPNEYWIYKFDGDTSPTTTSDTDIFYTYDDGISRDILNLFNIKKCQLEMLSKRGYDISEEEHILDMNLNNFATYLEDRGSNPSSFWNNALKTMKLTKEDNAVMTKNRAHLSEEYYRPNDEYPSCVVFFVEREGPVELRIKKDLTVALKDFALAGDYENIILISNKNFTKDSKGELSMLPPYNSSNNKSEPRGLWIFRDKELYINPEKHVLSPKHELLDAESSLAFKRTYRHPPHISLEDPVVKFNGWKLGSVIKITRDISSIEAPVDMMVAKRLVVRDNLVGLSDYK
tara:strand:+ start:564 stop:1487 length:924 start_codon:yes stop_codon:yes gene_type:complete